MICPACNTNDDKVIDSRATDTGRVIRRRRECLNCKKRFTTYERIEQSSRLMVVKRDGTRVPFNADSIRKGIQAACGKRPIPEAAKQKLVDDLDEAIHREFDREVSSTEIGRRAMIRLRQLDHVAYIRFASEHLRFDSLTEIIQEAESISEEPRVGKDQPDLF